MADEEAILDKVLSFSDVELAILLCLISREHGIISTPAHALDDLIQELRLIASRIFGLTCVVVECGPNTTLEDFAAGLLYPPKSQQPQQHQQPQPSTSPSERRSSQGHHASTRMESYFVSSPQRQPRGSISPMTAINTPAPAQKIANCILARNLDRAPRSVQIQALELLRTRRIFTRTAVQRAPTTFLFVPVLEAEMAGMGRRVTDHLNDFFSLAHWHDPDDGFVNVEEVNESSSRGSGARRRAVPDYAPAKMPTITEAETSQLAQMSQRVQVDVDVTRYQMNIVSFLRMHRAVAEGITPSGTKHLDKLMRCLAPLHKLDYVTPALVGLAAKKVYLHRIRITSAESERSVYWGSKVEAVAALLDGLGPEQVVDEVLGMVTAPL